MGRCTTTEAIGPDLIGVFPSLGGVEWRVHDLYCDGSSSGRDCSAASYCQLQLWQCTVAFVLNQTSSLKFRTASQVSSLVYHAVSLCNTTKMYVYTDGKILPPQYVKYDHSKADTDTISFFLFCSKPFLWDSIEHSCTTGAL